SGLLVAAPLCGGATVAPEGPYEADGRRSGYLYMGEEPRALQVDDFLNPGMFAVERGRQLLSRADGQNGRSCASCHDDAETSMRGVAARYPVFDAAERGLVNLEGRINLERSSQMDAEPFALESDELLALT